MHKCWFCGKEDGVMFFTMEFDAYFHMSCLYSKKQIGNPEREIILEELGMDEKSVVLVALHTENQKRYALLELEGKREWIEVDVDYDYKLYDVIGEKAFNIPYLHKKGTVYHISDGGVYVEEEHCQMYMNKADGCVYIRPYEMFHGFDEENEKRFKKM